jgi:SAM-dependent methyltransferase
MATDEVGAFKDGQRATWAAGDYAAVAEKIWEVGGRLVERLQPRPGERMLDVACGTGNVTIRAAQTGADVVGLDLTPSLLERAAAGAERAGVPVELIEGDAEALPFEDASFDVVSSVFGCMFAPRHGVTAGQLARVLAPGGRLGVCAWTPEGAIGHFFRTVGASLPPPPAVAEPPLAWGSPEHVAELFAGTGVALAFEREEVVLRFGSLDEAVGSYEREFGPIVMARKRLDPDDFDALIVDLRALLARLDTGAGGHCTIPAEYLVITGRKE